MSCLYVLKEGGVRVCGNAVSPHFWCGFSVFCILFCGIAVSLDPAVYGFWIILARFCGFLLLLHEIAVLSEKNVAVFCLYSVRFCGFRPSLTPASFRFLTEKLESLVLHAEDHDERFLVS